MPVVDKWPAYFESFADAGYNMVHYAPLNTRGDSNSPYSIYDQLSLSFDLFGTDRHLDEKIREKKLRDMLKLAHQEYGILAVTDVVWNHTAHNSAWLQEHPEAGYNLETAPHLRSAYELDEAIMGLYKDMAKAGISCNLRTEEHLTQIMELFKGTVLPRLRLWEFYVINVAYHVEELKKLWSAKYSKAGSHQTSAIDNAFKNIGLGGWAAALRKEAMSPNTILGTRFNKKVDHVAGLKIVERLVNAPLYKEHDEDVAAIITNVWSRARFFRVDPHGPKLGPISEAVADPFVDTYFTRLPLTVHTHKLHPDAMCLANNGWIWNGDPLNNFAGPGSKAYLRRDVIAWGDCVKLRYGDGPASNPWLWAHQKAYTEKMARLFHGFRIDNCHSTPIHVAAYLLDAARVINPDLYVFAELFTGSEDTDIKFVSELGINSLIREAMSAWDPKEMSRLVHRYGGTPIDSTFFTPITSGETMVVDVKGSSTHALFMDCTHDNETPHQKRTAEDTLPTCGSSIGSVKGFDEVVPELLNVVTETRRRFLLHTHSKMAREGYTEIHVHQEHDFISVHRVHPITHDGYLLIARCAFSKTHGSNVHSPIVLRNQAAHIVESAGLRVQSHLAPSHSSEDFLSALSGPHGPHDSEAIAHARDERSRVHGRKTIGAITGLPCFLDFSAVLTTLVHSRVEPINSPSGVPGIQTVLTVNNETFLPGSIVLYRTWMQGSGMDLVVPDPSMSPIPSPMRHAVNLTQSGGNSSVSPSPLLEVNVVLYRCGSEEFESIGDNVYDIPGHGFISVIQKVARNNDLGHGICSNLRAGPWMMDYVVGRLNKSPSWPTWLAERFAIVKDISPSFVPKYFFQIIYLAYNAVRFTNLLPFICPDTRSHRVSSLEVFAQALAMTSHQLYGREAPFNNPLGLASLAAGLPHFASRHMRCWGRDIFIALRGLFLIPGHFDAAKSHLIAFGSTLRHGLIPNLLDQGNFPRYNARDAAWWWMWGVQQYCKSSPEGLDFLKVKVKRRGDVKDKRLYAWETSVGEICHEILERHARGISFKEWNAGPNLDHAMKDSGFFVEIKTRFEDGSGIVGGGGKDNCGTWMDKMGDSEKAGTKGVPATPRDGGSVEIVGLVKAALRWVVEDVKDKFPADHVVVRDANDDKNYRLGNVALINARGIYKDTVGSSAPFTDVQFRPNFCVALVVAPELFDPEHARISLESVKNSLLGPLALDPKDWAYRGDYDNSNDSTDGSVAHGFNYHNGPEWGWLVGYFLRAYLYFHTLIGSKAVLLHQKNFIFDLDRNPYAGLPELTNANGEYCHHSCPTQAWSSATLLEVVNDLN
ncbi:glucanotransferase domain of glycogen debranching enzyme-domain-containing protein [Obelidium mucronatum]|nr:glucanotransferase domain of glycogen debranching enzyme-domain-containing protein [Obelidium mucronatum]